MSVTTWQLSPQQPSLYSVLFSGFSCSYIYIYILLERRENAFPPSHFQVVQQLHHWFQFYFHPLIPISWVLANKTERTNRNQCRPYAKSPFDCGVIFGFGWFALGKTVMLATETYSLFIVLQIRSSVEWKKSSEYVLIIFSIHAGRLLFLLIKRSSSCLQSNKGSELSSVWTVVIFKQPVDNLMGHVYSSCWKSQGAVRIYWSIQRLDRLTIIVFGLQLFISRSESRVEFGGYVRLTMPKKIKVTVRFFHDLMVRWILIFYGDSLISIGIQITFNVFMRTHKCNSVIVLRGSIRITVYPRHFLWLCLLLKLEHISSNWTYSSLIKVSDVSSDIRKVKTSLSVSNISQSGEKRNNSYFRLRRILKVTNVINTPNLCMFFSKRWSHFDQHLRTVRYILQSQHNKQ